MVIEMIKNALAYVSMLGSTVVPVQYLNAATMNDINYRVNEYITVLSSYYGAISKKQVGNLLEAEVSDDIQHEDMLIMFIATSGGQHKKLPHGFREVMNTVKGKGDLSLVVAYKIWLNGDPLVYPIEKSSKNYFASLITLRGPKYILDAKARINTASGDQGLAITPRVETANGGAVISAFAYDDPHAVNVLDQKTIVSIKNGDDGLAVGIGSSDGGLSKRIKATGDSSQRGGGNDIAMALSIY